MRTIYVAIPTQDFERLRELAQLEFRGAKEQALVLILEGLERHAVRQPRDGNEAETGDDRPT